MWARILKAKHSDSNDTKRLVIAQDPCKGSSLWNHIIKGRGVLWKNIRWKVGRGTKVEFWKDVWLYSNYSYPFCKYSQQLEMRWECSMGVWFKLLLKERSLL